VLFIGLIIICNVAVLKNVVRINE